MTSVAIHIYEPGHPGEPPAFETIAVVGPFADLESAAKALTTRGWACDDPDRRIWDEGKRRLGPTARIIDLVSVVPLGATLG